ncbi:MAG: hypothetical protein HY764_00755 [Candidatus Portnoybacteria bacterium]|nr:hypothetical protein [Candidatus Portnoybacteria bacterium]
MIDQKLADYIKQSLASGFSKEKTREDLLQVGWSEGQVQEALDSLFPPSQQQAQPQEVKIIYPSFGSEISESPAIKEESIGSPLSSKMKPVALGLICLFGIIGLAFFAYSQFLSPSPERVVKQAIGKMGKDLRSFRYDFLFEIGTKKISSVFENNIFGAIFSAIADNSSITLNAQDSETELTIESAGFFDFKDIKQPKIDINFELNTLGSPINFSFSGQLKHIDKETYFKLENFPIPFAGDSTFDNKWIRVTKEDLEKSLKDLGMESALDDYEQQREELGLRSIDNALSQAEEEQLRDLIKQTNLFNIKEEKENDILLEDDNKIKSFHYLVTLNASEIRNFLSRVAEILKTEKDYFENEEVFREFADELAKISGEIWVGKSDRMIHKIVLKKEEPVVAESKIKEFSAISLSLSNFNESMELEKPADSKPLSEFLESVIEVPRAKAEDAQRKATINQMVLVMEMYYDENTRYPDLPNNPVPIPPNSEILAPYNLLIPLSNETDAEYAYYWTDSSRNGGGYCVWTKLKTTSQATFALVNEKGFVETKTLPNKDNCFSLR